MNSAARAKWRPGQILCSSISGSSQHQPHRSAPSPIAKRERGRITLADVDFSVADKTSGTENIWVSEHQGIMQASPVRIAQFVPIGYNSSYEPYHVFGTKIVPSGIKYPRSSSSTVAMWGTERGTTGRHRRASITIALT